MGKANKALQPTNTVLRNFRIRLSHTGVVVRQSALPVVRARCWPLKAGDGLILQTIDGHRFMLWSLEDWEGFDVGESDDFGQEAESTSQNTELLTVLTERRSHGKRIPLNTLKEELGCEI